MVINLSVGERIIELRKASNMSQGDLAKVMNVSRQAVSKWENGISSPDTVNLIQLADVLDTDVEYLATGRKTSLRRPPVVLKSVEYVEKVVEKPVIQYVDRIVEKKVPVIEYIEKPVVHEVPVIKKVFRNVYRRRPAEYILLGVICFFAGVAVGVFL